jgi:hypothetical protein
MALTASQVEGLQPCWKLKEQISRSCQGISDGTVRAIEHPALDALSCCLALEAAGREIIPMRIAKAFSQWPA